MRHWGLVAVLLSGCLGDPRPSTPGGDGGPPGHDASVIDGAALPGDAGGCEGSCCASFAYDFSSASDLEGWTFPNGGSGCDIAIDETLGVLELTQITADYCDGHSPTNVLLQDSSITYKVTKTDYYFVSLGIRVQGATATEQWYWVVTDSSLVGVYSDDGGATTTPIAEPGPLSTPFWLRMRQADGELRFLTSTNGTNFTDHGPYPGSFDPGCVALEVSAFSDPVTQPSTARVDEIVISPNP